MADHNLSLAEARDWAIVDCVEPTGQGNTMGRTNSCYFNLAKCLELALNDGRCQVSGAQLGPRTGALKDMASFEELKEAYAKQVDYFVEMMVRSLNTMELLHARETPHVYSSMLIDGCMESGRDCTDRGALHESTGVNGVGLADVADSLAALDEVVFRQKKYKMQEVLQALFTNFKKAPILRAELQKAPKFGNDNNLPDGYANLTAKIYHDALGKHKNIRGGAYVPGFYSVTCHVAFGKRTPALPSGRVAGEPLAPSLGPSNGKDRLGPTALLNSVAKVDSRLAMNGYALNLRFDPETVAGEKGVNILSSLVKGFFSQGGMEMQLNVLDPEMMEDARRNPGKYPGLVVRVAGYCAYFDDLPDSTKAEIITRTRLRA